MRRPSLEGSTQAALTKQRNARKAAALDAKVSEALSDLIEGEEPEQALRALGKRLAEKLRSVVGELEASTFLASLSASSAPAPNQSAARQAAEALFTIKRKRRGA